MESAEQPQTSATTLAIVMMESGVPGGMDGMWIWVILGLAGLWVLVAMICRAVIGPRSPTSGPDAQDTLDRRLASGGITTDEYRRISDTLRGARSTRPERHA